MGMVMKAKQGVLRPCSSYPPTTASRLRSRLAKGRGSPKHGASYGLVAGAATQIRGQQLLQSLWVVDDPRVLLQRAGSQHQEPRGAEAALQGVFLGECPLQRNRLAVGTGESLHGSHLPSVALHSEHQARAHRLSPTSTVQDPHTPCSQPRCV